MDFEQETKKLLEELFDEKNFKSPSSSENLVPKSQGIYCIRLKEFNAFPVEFTMKVKTTNHNIIYIGIAKDNLFKRLFRNELRGRGHGTFFRSIGAILGYLPEVGSLKNKVNQTNYTFSKEDKIDIIDWIDTNLLINWIELETNINFIELLLIKEYKPLINIQHNPEPNQELRKLRDNCRHIAAGK